jgi:hypothetical protein
VLAASVADVDLNPSAAHEGGGWIVLDIETGKPIAMLQAPEFWYGDWVFGLFGWLGPDTALLQGAYGLFAWTPSTGAIERVTQGPPPFNASLAMDALD